MIGHFPARLNPAPTGHCPIIHASMYVTASCHMVTDRKLSGSGGEEEQRDNEVRTKRSLSKYVFVYLVAYFIAANVR